MGGFNAPIEIKMIKIEPGLWSAFDKSRLKLLLLLYLVIEATPDIV